MKFIGFVDDLQSGSSHELQADPVEKAPAARKVAFYDKPGGEVPKSYKDPYWLDAAARAANEFGVPPDLLQGILTRGERSNADQVSSAGARTPFQIIPSTRKAFIDKYGIDAYESPDNAARVAALHVKESLDRGASLEVAVREYHGGPDRAKWGPVNDAYAVRVLGEGSSPKRSAKAKPELLGFLDAENPYRVEAPEAMAEPEAEQGDMSRGAEVAWKQNKSLVGGVTGMAGASGEKAFGGGGFFTGLKNWGLDLAREGDEDVQEISKPSDDIVEAYNKAKGGEYGPLIDNIQFNIGYMGTQVAQSAALALMGAGVGLAAGGPPGAATGGVAGAVATNLGKGLFAKFVEKEAARMAAKELGKDAGEEALKAAAKGMMGTAQKRVAGAIGAGTALTAYNLGMETGQIYPMAEEQAQSEGRELTGGDLWKAMAWSAGSAGTETVTDVVSVAALLGRIGIPGVGGRVAKALTAGGINAFMQGGQEAVQTVMEHKGAGKPLEGHEFARDLINSAWGPAPFSFLTGLGVGAFHGGRKKSVGAPVIEGEPDNTPAPPDNTQEGPDNTPLTPDNTPDVAPATPPVAPQQRAQEIQAEAAQRMAQGQPIADLAAEARALMPEIASREQKAAEMAPFLENFQKEVLQASVLDSADQLKDLAKVDIPPEEKTKQGQKIKEAMLGAEEALRAIGATIPEVDHDILKLEFKPSIQDYQEAEAKTQASLSATLPKTAMGEALANVEARKQERFGTPAPTINEAAHEASTSPLNDLPEPTEAQKEATNYKMGHDRISGMEVSIENPIGSRRWPDGPELKSHYGKILTVDGERLGPIGKDKDHLDAFFPDLLPRDFYGPVAVVNQRKGDTDTLDEHKVVFGAGTEQQARRMYGENYPKGWNGAMSVALFPDVQSFKGWLKGKDFSKPAVSPSDAEQTPAAPPKAQSEPPIRKVETPTLETVGHAVAPVSKDGGPQPLPQRLAESADDLYRKVKEITDKGGVVTGHGLLLPVVKVIGVGDARISSNGIEIIENGGRTARAATKNEVSEVHSALEGDQADVVLMSRWGGSGGEKATRSKFISRLHVPHGNSFEKTKEPQSEPPSLDSTGPLVDAIAETKPPEPETKPAKAETKPQESDAGVAKAGRQAVLDYAIVRGAVASDNDFVYHATNAERADEIAASKLRRHKAHEFTDQDTWPDGSTEKRSYFTPAASNTWQFAPEYGTPVLLRVRRDAQPLKKERSTGDLYSVKDVPAKSIEYLSSDGSWRPLTDRRVTGKPGEAGSEPATSAQQAVETPPAAEAVKSRRAVDVPIKMGDGGVKLTSGWRSGDFLAHKAPDKGYRVTHIPSSKQLSPRTLQPLTKDQALEYAKRFAAMHETWDGVGKPPDGFLEAAKKVRDGFDPSEVGNASKVESTAAVGELSSGTQSPRGEGREGVERGEQGKEAPREETPQVGPVPVSERVEVIKEPPKAKPTKVEARSSDSEVSDGPSHAELSARYGDLSKITVSREAVVPGTTRRLSVDTTASDALIDIDRQLNMARSLFKCLSA